MKPSALVIMVVMLVMCGIFIQSIIAEDAVTTSKPNADAAAGANPVPGTTKAPSVSGNNTGNGTDSANGHPSITGSAVQCAIISFLVVSKMFYQTL